MRILLRDGNAQNFANKLLEIGEDRLVIEASGMIKLSSHLCVSVKTFCDMIQAVYPNVNQNYKNLEWLRERAILAPKKLLFFERRILRRIYGPIEGAEKIYGE